VLRRAPPPAMLILELQSIRSHCNDCLVPDAFGCVTLAATAIICMCILFVYEYISSRFVTAVLPTTGSLAHMPPA
jgi:hypothetical protein